MSDLADRAQPWEEAHLAAALRDQRRRARAAGISAAHCVDCDGEIPAARQRAVAGCVRCVDCQQWAERWLGRSGK